MCPHGYHHNGFMATPALGTQDLLYFYVHAKPIWEIANNVILPSELISHDMVMFGYEIK